VITPRQRLARVSLVAERDGNAAMRSLLADLDRQIVVLRRRAKFDPTAIRQLDKVLKRQSQAWSELNSILDRDREAARKAANLAATDAEKRLLALLPLSASRRKQLTAGPEFSRDRNAEVARRISSSRDTARRLLVKNLNRKDTGKELADTVKSQISPRTKGGVSYVARRLIRTEIAMAYQAAQIERAAMTPWVTGLRWRVSPDHKGPDVCDIYNHKEYSIHQVPAIPHPNCMCTLEPVLMTEDEFTQALNGGLFDSIIGREVDVVKGRSIK
jgi:hypothetical protein